MPLASSLLGSLTILPYFLSQVTASPELWSRTPNSTCAQIANAISPASDVYYPLDLTGTYHKDISHWASSSTQTSACSVEPGTAEDVATILGIVGSTETPFAVKGGGHIANPGFSSTEGVHIAMYRFSEVTYDAASQTVVVGAGLVWDEVYEALEPHGVNVVGGRVTGVGVAGFTLGGGYSWKSNQYGLTIDNTIAYELVKPDGTITTITEDDEDLFFALKGGFNNFGIVTRFTFKTYPQTQVWGGLITYTADQIPRVINATAKFSADVTDPKASLITTVNFIIGQPGISELLFYDGPEPPAGIFDDFLDIPHFTMDVSTRSFVSLVQASPSDATAGTRGVFHTVPLRELSLPVLNAIVNDSVHYGAKMSLQSGSFISYDIEPFLPTTVTQGAASAYPPTRDVAYLPLNIYWAYTSSLFDQQFWDNIKESAAHLKSVAIADGQDLDDASIYPNYCIFDTPLEDMYGGNVGRLSSIKEQVDPDNVMGLAGGFKF